MATADMPQLLCRCLNPVQLFISTMVNTLINNTAESVIIIRDEFSKYFIGGLRDTADKDLTFTELIAEIKDQLKTASFPVLPVFRIFMNLWFNINDLESYRAHIEHLDAFLIIFPLLLVTIQLFVGKVKVAFQK